MTCRLVDLTCESRYYIRGIRRLRVQTSEKQDGGGTADSIRYLDRPGELDCIYYMRTGMCGYGVNCRFNHPSNLGQIGQYGGELPERVRQPDCGGKFMEQMVVFFLHSIFC